MYERASLIGCYHIYQHIRSTAVREVLPAKQSQRAVKTDTLWLSSSDWAFICLKRQISMFAYCS